MNRYALREAFNGPKGDEVQQRAKDLLNSEIFSIHRLTIKKFFGLDCLRVEMPDLIRPDNYSCSSEFKGAIEQAKRTLDSFARTVMELQ